MASPASLPTVVIGVDGGGTKTNVVCLDCSTKKILAQIKTTSTNWNSVGAENAKKTLLDGINSCLAEAKISKDHGKEHLAFLKRVVVGVGMGMSGVDRPEDKKAYTGWILELLPHLKLNETGHLVDKITITNDAIAALASGNEGHLFGVVVISGTGSIALGMDSKGNSTRAGGWG